MNSSCTKKGTPADWSTLPLGELCRLGGGSIQTGPFGSQLHSDDYREDGVPIITVEHLRAGKIMHGNLPLVGESDFQRLIRYTLQTGDLVFSRVGAIDRCVYVTEGEHGWLFSGRCLRVRSGRGHADARFLSYLLNSWYQRLWILNHSVGSTMPCLNTAILSNVPIDLPPLPEQRRIAEILSTLDRTIEETEALISKYQQIKTGLMHDLFTRGVTPDGKLRPARAQAPHLYKESPLGWIPNEWQTVRLDNSEIRIIDGDRGENYPQEHELRDSGHCLFLSAANVTRHGFKFDQLQFISNEKDQLLGTGKLTRGDVVVTTRGTVGNIALFDDNVPFPDIRINSGMVILRCDQSDLSPDFLYSSLANFIFGREFKRVVSGSAQPQLPIKDLRHFHCLILPVSEQQLLLSRVKSVDAYLLSEDERLLTLLKTKRGLMHDLLTGRVRVEEAEDS